MKRLALLLGSLLVVTAAASAKEVVPAPVVVEEAPVQIVEKEVIVYRDKEEGFRPNGSFHMEYKPYGKTEDTNNLDGWNSANVYARQEYSGAVNMTENQRLEVRVRDYNNLQSLANTSLGTETRIRYYYDHGTVGDSKVQLSSRVEYFDKKDNSQSVEYQPRFDFAEYLFNNDFVKTSKFVVAPGIKYGWESTNDNDYTNEYSVDVETIHTFPYGFDLELNVYNTYYSYGKTSKDNIDNVVELYLHYNHDLYTNGKWTVSLSTEWGYDPYTVNDKRANGDRSYTLKADQWVTATYQATEFVSVFGGVGACYQNYAVTAESSASHWRWQPYALVGFDVAF